VAHRATYPLRNSSLTLDDPIDINRVRLPVDNDSAVDDQPGAAVELPPPPLPGVWPKRLWILILVTAVVAPLLVWLFIKALGYRGGGDFGGMGAMSAVLNALPLLAAWVVAIVSRLRRSLVRRRTRSLLLWAGRTRAPPP